MVNKYSKLPKAALKIFEITLDLIFGQSHVVLQLGYVSHALVSAAIHRFLI
jgi:hypothetical protein